MIKHKSKPHTVSKECLTSTGPGLCPLGLRVRTVHGHFRAARLKGVHRRLALVVIVATRLVAVVRILRHLKQAPI